MDFTSYAIYRKIISKKHVVDGTVLGSISFDLIWLKAKKAGHDIVETFTIAFLKHRITYFHCNGGIIHGQLRISYKYQIHIKKF